MRTRTVYPPAEIPHLWAHQTTCTAKNSQGNVSFNGEILFSYAEDIGRIITHKGEKIALFRDRSWSKTTSRHQLRMRSAANHLRSFTVQNIGRYTSALIDHKENLAHYAAKIEKAATLAVRARSNREWRIRAMEAIVSEANSYAKLFGYKPKFVALDAEALEALKIKAAKEAKREEKRTAKRNAERQAQHNARMAEILAKDLPAWMNGGPNVPFHLGDFTGTDYMRLRGDEVETSRGARVPLAHVRRAMQLVMAIPLGTEWHSNGHTIPVGHYTIDRVDAAGTVFVGCHKFNRAEIERVRDLLAVTPELATA